MNFIRGRGCKGCDHTGYRGRIAIIEVLVVDDIIRELINRRAPTGDIREAAIELMGMATLRQNGLDKVKGGLTSLEEVLRLTSESQTGRHREKELANRLGGTNEDMSSLLQEV